MAGAIFGFLVGLGGGPAAAIVAGVFSGGLFYLVSGVKSTRAPLAAKPPAPGPAPSAPSPAAPQVAVDGWAGSADRRLTDVEGVLREALIDGIITEAAYDAMGAIARRRLRGVPPAAPAPARERRPIVEGETAVDRFLAKQELAVPPVEEPSPPAPPPPPPRGVVRVARSPEPDEHLRPARPSVPARRAPAPRPAPRPVRVEPSRVITQLRRIWKTLISDFALHGLAYAGVLLVFVATLGFVIFAFSGVQSSFRPVAEGVIPMVLFGAARFLKNRGAPFVSRALTLLAGAVTPIVVFAAFQDGAGIPPDLGGAPLLILLTALALGLAGMYARASAGDPGSPLRFLVGPLVWVAVGVIGMAFHSEPSPAQMGLVILVVAASAVLARRRSDHALSKPTLDVTLPATGVAYLLLVLFASAQGWPALPALAGGIALVALTEVLPGRLRYPALGQALVIGATAGLVVPAWGAGPAAAGAAVAFVAFAEVWAVRPDPQVNLPVGASLGAIALFAAWLAPWPMVVGGSLLGVWGHIRRLSPTETMDPEPRRFLTGTAVAAAVVAPTLAAGGLLRAIRPETALLAVGAVVAVVAIGVWRLARQDGFYAWWIPGAAAAVALGSVIVERLQTAPATGWLAGAVALATLAFGFAPRWPVVRIWLGGASGLWAIVLGLDAADVALEFRAPTIAVLGALTVLSSTAGRDRSLGHLSVLGHIVTAGGLLAADPGGPALVALAAFTTAWTVEAVAGELGRSALRNLLEHFTPPLPAARWAVASIAPTVASISVPFLTADLATFTGLVTEAQRGRMGLLLAGLALGYAGIARAAARRRPLAPLLTVGGFFLSGVAIAVAAPEPWPTILALASSIGVVAIVGGELRRPIMTWFAWAMSAILVILLGGRAGVPADHLHLVLLGWGALSLLGGLAIDDVRAGRRLPGVGLRVEWVIRPVALGALAIPVALSFAFDAPPAEAWPAAAAAALVYGMAALMLRAGSTSVAFYGLAAYAMALRLADTSLSVTDHPWVLSYFTLALTATAFGSWLATAERRVWLRWDIAPLVVGHATAAFALALTSGAGSVPAVFAAHGAIALAVSAWQRRWVWALGGTVLLLIGAGAAGSGWLALTTGILAGLAAAATSVSARYRQPLQWAAVGFAGWAWAEAIIWLGWWPDGGVALTAAAAGGLAALAVVAIRTRLLARDWIGPSVVLSLAGMGAALSGVVASSPDPGPAGIGLAVGFAGLAAAAGLAARPFDFPDFREAAGVLGVVPGVWLIYGLEPSAGTNVAWAAPLGLAASLAAAALWRDRRSVWSPPLAIAGALVFTGGWLIGLSAGANGWLGILFAAISLAALAGAGVTDRGTRFVLEWTAAIAAALAWSRAVVWAGWWPEPAVLITAVGGGILAILLAGAVRAGWVAVERAAPWATLSAFAVAGMALTVLAGYGARTEGGLGVALGLAGLSVASGLAARPVDPRLRPAAGILAGLVGPALAYGYQPAGGTVVALAVPLGLVAGLGGALAWRTRSSEWAVPAMLFSLITYLIGLLVGIAATAHGWLAVLLLSAALASVVGALVTEGDLRWMLQAGSAVVTVGAWSQVIAWAGWWPEPAVPATINGAAGLGLMLAIGARHLGLDRSWVLTWGVAAALTTVAGLAFLPELGRRPGGLAAAAGLFVWAAAAALAARPLQLVPLRESAALLVLAAGAALGYAYEPTLSRQVAMSLLAGMAATVLTVGVRLGRPESPWIRPLVLYATLAQLGAILAAVQALPGTGLLSAALAVVGIQAMVVGGLLGFPAFVFTGPPLLLGSWLLFAADALGGNSQWYTIPIGITILVLVDVLRWDTKRRDATISAPAVAYADYAAMAFMVGASLIQVITRSAAHGLIAVVAGIVILGWAAATRLRRRAFGGAGAIVAASVLIVAVPLARIVPQFRGVALWAAIAALGGAMIAIASTLEQGKARVAATVTRLDELMEGWE